jgi:CheY-like chemotaxis protein
VLSNLINNAAKYTPRGGTVVVSVALEGRQAVIGVRDTGIGISPDLLETVFDLFVQGERSLARTEGGLGVGLSLVKQLVSMHGGSVEAHSAGAGKGSEFVVRLPAIDAAGVGTPGSGASPPEQRGGGSSRSRRVLIVDDNEDAGDMLAILLKEFGHHVCTARDGAGALAVAVEFKPEFVLLDIGLPEMNGYEVARRMRELPGLDKATYVAVTGYGQPSDRAESERAGMKYHFVKPIDAAELQKLLAA